MYETGFLWIWEKETDLIGSDLPSNFWDVIQNLESVDREFKWVDQSSRPLTHSCTMASAYGVVCSIFNKECSQDEMLDIEEEAHNDDTMRYVRWKWWYTQEGVSHVVKYWNEKNTDHNVLYFRTTIWSPEYWKAMSMGYGCVVTRHLSSKRKEDSKDLEINWYDFDDVYSGHAEAIYPSIKEWFNWYVVNQYPKKDYNRYHVNDITKQDIYFPACYIILPYPKEKTVDLLLQKVIKKAMLYIKTIDVKLWDSDIKEASRKLIDLYYKKI